MPDISMCNGKECPQRNTCRRFRAIPNIHWQAYFSDPPWDKWKMSCEYHMSIEGWDERHLTPVK